MVKPTAFYRTVLSTLRAAGVPFLIGGAYALAHHTYVRRRTKDLDLMIRRNHWNLAADALRAAAIRVWMPFPHWLGKARHGRAQVDIIFSSGNGLTAVDDAWFTRAIPARLHGFNVDVCAAEELLWSKAFVMERERYDGADVLHLILAQADRIDWRHLCHRFLGHERVLLSYVLLFGYVYPGEAARLPRWLVSELLGASIDDHPPGRLCRGTLLSREQYLVDVMQQKFVDARRPPVGSMSAREIAIWTRAIAREPQRHT